MPIKPGVDELVAAGRYAEAAALARDRGDLMRAAELYERIWEWAQAAQCARDGGDLARALGSAIESRDQPLIEEISAALIAGGDEGKRAALEVYRRRRRWSRAGELAEDLGDLERAVECYRRAHRDVDAARLLEDLGRDREAGRLYERVIDQGSDPMSTPRAHLRLGVILARRMQHDAAVRHLQEATRSEATRADAQKVLVVELAALGLRDAARDALTIARALDPALPVDLDAFIREQRQVLVAESRGDQDGDEDVVAGRYRLGKLIGSGGSGRVFEARDEVSGRRVAIKLLHTAHARGRPAYERFVREAKVAGALRHPNLVEVYDFSAEQGYTVMELMPGGSLEKRVGQMSASAARRMILDVLGGLELAHQRGIIHRDVKPANIFFDARGTAKLGDFGVAHLLDLGQTQTGGLIGTLAYMSPEQITGARLTITADLYSVGVTLFEALTGRLPFLGPDFVAQHLGEAPPAGSEAAEGVSPAWDPILARLLAKDPQQRYDSIGALRRDIQAVELEDAAQPRLLVLPRARPAGELSSTATSDSHPHGPAPGGSRPGGLEAEPEQPRYQFETSIGQTAESSLGRALDASLNRSVIVERFDRGTAMSEHSERRLYGFARCGSPFVQRPLAFDKQAGVVVYEAPAGEPMSEAFANERIPPRFAARLLKRLARGVAALHVTGHAHGAIDASKVVIDDIGNPTIITSGLRPAQSEPDPKQDIEAIVEIVTTALAVDSTPEALVDALASGLSNPERAVILQLADVRDGEALYAFIDAIEIALLKAERRDAS